VFYCLSVAAKTLGQSGASNLVGRQGQAEGVFHGERQRGVAHEETLQEGARVRSKIENLNFRIPADGACVFSSAVAAEGRQRGGVRVQGHYWWSLGTGDVCKFDSNPNRIVLRYLMYFRGEGNCLVLHTENLHEHEAPLNPVFIDVSARSFIISDASGGDMATGTLPQRPWLQGSGAALPRHLGRAADGYGERYNRWRDRTSARCACGLRTRRS